MPSRTLPRETRIVKHISTGQSRASQAEMPREEMLREWLGVEVPELSYYGLLGVPELESDEKAILEAGRRVKRKVRAYQIGLYRKQALGLLAEIGQAVSTLTNPEKKRACDNALMARWRQEGEDLAREHLGQGERTPEALEAWLTACRDRGIPVARLMPYLMQRVMARASGWPKVGVHHIVLPVAVWTYRDAAVLGQCLAIGPLEKRAESVKKTQRMLGIPLGIARMVAEEVARSVHAFKALRLVRQAKDNPEMTLLRLGRRIRRYDGHLGKGKVLAAVARLLGKKKTDLDEALAHIDEPPVEMPRGLKAARAARAAKDRVHSLGGVPGVVLAWVGGRPEILISAAVAAGIVTFVLVVLVVVGVLGLPGPEVPAAGGGAQEEWPVPSFESPDGPTPPPNAGGGESSTTAAGTTETGLDPNGSAGTAAEPPEWLQRFREKYPTERPETPKEEGPSPDVKFFGVKGEKREDGSPVQLDPESPAP